VSTMTLIQKYIAFGQEPKVYPRVHGIPVDAGAGVRLPEVSAWLTSLLHGDPGDGAGLLKVAARNPDIWPRLNAQHSILPPVGLNTTASSQRPGARKAKQISRTLSRLRTHEPCAVHSTGKTKFSGSPLTRTQPPLSDYQYFYALTLNVFSTISLSSDSLLWS
jgi:hypothetical protein